VVHRVNFLVSVLAVREKLADRRRDRVDERGQVSEVDVRYGVGLVGLILFERWWRCPTSNW
jgi:hypothetical protein